MDHKKIGAALIVKNEEKNIGRVISSLKSVCKQIVVVDTGSVDTTPSVCSMMGVELYFKKWTDDFSEARNFALGFMRTDWIISIDADEELDSGSLIEHLHLFDDPVSGGIRVKILNDLSTGGIREHTYTRIFRNHPNIRYSGRIHEQISDSITDAGLSIVDSEIKITHHGYNTDEAERITRNKSLLEKEISENENDPWLKYHYAETLFSEGNSAIAMNLYQQLTDSPMLSELQKDTVRLRIGQIALSMNDYALALELDKYSFADTDIEGLRLLVLVSTNLMTGNKARSKELWNNNALHQSRMVDKNLLETISKVL